MSEILQFGTGAFLRAFVDLFVHEANMEGQKVGKIVAVQSTGHERAAQLNALDGRYHVAIRGFIEGQTVDEVIRVESVGRAFASDEEWGSVLAEAAKPELRWIVSNATEASYSLEDGDPFVRPRSFPAKLAAVLFARFNAGGNPVSIFPLELIEGNGGRLRELVLRQMEIWNCGEDLKNWVDEDCLWFDSLVDRITPGRPANHPLLDQDPLLVLTEPFSQWVLQADDPPFRHRSIQTVKDVRPYYLRKVRILNGAHSALVAKAMPMGLRTVREAVEDAVVGLWLESLLFEEIVPTLDGRVEGPEAFARECLERFRNPYIDHRLESIAAGHEGKVRLRLLPTLEEFRSKIGTAPPLLSEIIGS